MGDARLDNKQLSQILLWLDRIVAAVTSIRDEIHHAMANRRRSTSTPMHMTPAHKRGHAARRRR
jgi:hypothetical protein